MVLCGNIFTSRMPFFAQNPPHFPGLGLAPPMALITVEAFILCYVLQIMKPLMVYATVKETIVAIYSRVVDPFLACTAVFIFLADDLWSLLHLFYCCSTE
jgi:hypothetical protein